MRFTAEDFLRFNDKVIPGEKDSLDCIADIANAKLEEWLKDAPQVDENGFAIDPRLKDFIREEIYVQPKDFDYSKVKHKFIP